MLKNLKLKWKIVLPMLLLSLLPLLLIVFYLINSSKETLRDNIGNNFVSLSSQILQQLDNTLISATGNLKLEAENEFMQDILSGDIDGRISNRIGKIISLNAVFSTVFVTNMEDKIIASTQSEYMAKSYPVKIVKKSDDDTYIQYKKDPLSGKEEIVVFTPIKASYDPSSNLGYLVSFLDINAIKKQIHAVKIGEMAQSDDFFVSIISNKGDLIVEPKNKNNKFIKNFQSTVQGEKNDEGFKEFENYLVAYKSTASYQYAYKLDGNIVLAEKESIAFEKINDMIFWAIIIIIIAAIVIILISLKISSIIVLPIIKITKNMGELSFGDFTKRMDVNSTDEIGELSEAYNQVANSISAIVDRISIIVDSVKKGKLEIDRDTSKFEGGWKNLASGIIELVEAFLKPLRLSSDYIAKISKGELPPKITEIYYGEFNTNKNNLNLLISTLELFSSEISYLFESQQKGDSDALINTTKFNGIYKKLAVGVNNMTSELNFILIKILAVIGEYGNGNFSVSLEPLPGKRAIANDRLDTVKDNLEKVLEQIFRLVDHSKNGNLEKRAKSEGFAGEWYKLIDGINEIVEVFAIPLNRSINVLEEMAVNDFSSSMDSLNYKGRFYDLSESINKVSKQLNNIGNITSRISEGNLEDLPKLKAIGKLSEKDKLLPSFIKMMEAIKSLVDDSTQTANNLLNGNINAHIEEKNHFGEYGGVAKGINNIIKQLKEPLNTSINYLEKIANGDNEIEFITENYKGDFNRIKDSVNTVVKVIKDVQNSIGELAINAQKGDLEKRIDTTEFKNSWSTLTTGINNILDNLLKPTKEAVSIIKKMETGDLSDDMKGDYEGDHAVLKDALNHSLGSLNTLLNEVNVTIKEVASGSDLVSSASQSLSNGAIEQSSSIEEVSESVKNIEARTKNNADNASIASKFANETKMNAEAGTKMMNELIDAMTKMTNSSTAIKKIIKVIDDIAFQTNLLAINAAVEAARAGIHGKGFAVVASEVRNLAQKSAKAAQETTELVEGIVSEVEDGNTISGKTAKSFEEIVDKIIKVADLTKGIYVASEDQNTALKQISIGITSVGNITQQSTANAEETASASVELSSQSDQLQQMIAKFKLKGNSFSLNGRNVVNKFDERRNVNSEKAIGMTVPANNKEYENDFGEF